MLNKHKLFLLCAKWIPVVTAIGILVTNTIAYYGCNDIVVDIFNFNIGTSVAKEERGIKIGAGNVEIKIPFINKAIVLDKDDINEFKEMLSKIQQ